MKDWSKEYNKLPYEARHIAGAVSCQTNIQFLNFEKQRLKKRYQQSLKEINDHIKNLEKWMEQEFNDDKQHPL